MDNEIEILCDGCGQEITKDGFRILEKQIDEKEEIIEKYFECPFCKRHYTVSVTDPYMREEIENMINLQERISKGMKNKKMIAVVKRQKEYFMETKKNLMEKEKELKKIHGLI